MNAEEKARRLRAMSPAEIFAEEQRQAGDLADLIHQAIEDHGSTTDVAMLNSVFAALVQVEAVLLATLDRDTRRRVRKMAEAARPKVLAAALAHGYPPVMILRGGRHDA